MSRSRFTFRTEVGTEIEVIYFKDNLPTKSTIKELPTDILEKVASEAGVELMERDDGFEDYLEELEDDKNLGDW